MSRPVTVRRSGGFAGLAREQVVDLDDDSPAAAGLAELVGSGRLEAAAGGVPQPDRFVYRVTGAGVDVEVHEPGLPRADRELLDTLLRP